MVEQRIHVNSQCPVACAQNDHWAVNKLSRSVIGLQPSGWARKAQSTGKSTEIGHTTGQIHRDSLENQTPNKQHGMHHHMVPNSAALVVQAPLSWSGFSVDFEVRPHSPEDVRAGGRDITRRSEAETASASFLSASKGDQSNASMPHARQRSAAGRRAIVEDHHTLLLFLSASDGGDTAGASRSAARCGHSAAAPGQRDNRAAPQEVESSVPVGRRASLSPPPHRPRPSSVPLGQYGATSRPGS